MPDLIRLDMIFIIAGVVALIVVHLILQLPLLFRVDSLCSPDILFLCGIGADHKRFQHRLRQRRTGLQAAHDDQEHCAKGKNQQDGRMTPDDFDRFPGGITDLLCGFFSGLRCILNGSSARAPLGCGILPANGTLLLPSGIRIAGELWMLLLSLFFQYADVGPIQPLFRFLQPLVGTHLMRMIGMFAHLQRCLRLLIRLQGSGHGYVSVGYQYSDTQDTITQSITNGATDVLEGSTVNFCAIPEPGYKFDGWYTDSGCSAANKLDVEADHTVTVSGTVTRYAQFSALDYKPEANKIKLLISKSAVDTGTDHEAGNNNVHYWGAIEGDVTIPTNTYYTNVNGAKNASDNFYLVTLDCSKDGTVGCLVNTSKGTYTTQTKNFDNLSKGNTYFINWSGKGTTGGECVTYSLPTAVYPITLNVTNAEMGTTYVKAYAEEDSEVIVNATLADSTNNKVTVTANSVDITSTKKFDATADNPNTVTVVYAAKELYTVTYSSNDGGEVTATAGGKTIESGSKVLEGTSVTFTATPDNNHVFSKWTIGGTDYSGNENRSKAVTVNADMVRGYLLQL